MSEVTAIVLAAVFTLCCTVSAYFFLRAYRREDFKSGLWLKTVTSLFFTVVGMVLMISGGVSKFALLTVCGLVLGLAGDVLLAFRQIYKAQCELFFTIGAVSFAIGHAMYVLALRTFSVLNWWIILAVFIVGAALSHWYAVRMKIDVGKKKTLAMLYVAIVVFMAAVAVCVAITSGSPAAILFAVGGVLFAVSDNILCAYSYGKNPVWRMNRSLHIAYYGAQLAIAWSILLA